jgi:hypothetical protein
MAIADKGYKSGKYEQEYERQLKASDGSDTGVTVWVKGLDCDASLAVHDRYMRKVTDIRIRATGDDLEEGVTGDLVVDEMRDRYIASISRWDFGGEELFDGEGDPDVSDYTTKRRFFNIPAFGEQVRKWVSEVGDFSMPSKEG